MALATDDKGREAAKAKAETAQMLEAKALEMKKNLKKASLPQVSSFPLSATFSGLPDTFIPSEGPPSLPGWHVSNGKRPASRKRLSLQVEVACLEDVILQMERDPSDRWAEAFFVPPGSLSASK